MLSLSTTQLRYLDAIVRAETWGTAAQRLGVSASALSQGIAELERRLGFELFERSGRRRRLRDDAGPVLDYARSVLAQTDDLEGWLRERRAGRIDRVRVGMIDAAAIVHFADALRTYRRDRPGVELHLVVSPSGALLDDLRRGELDVVVCVDPEADDPAISTSALLSEPLRVYAPEGASRHPRSSWGPWVGFPPGSHTRRLIGRALAAEGVTYDVVAESNQPEVLEEMVRLGIGWTVLPVSQAEAEPQPLVPVRKRPLVERTLVAATRSASIGSTARAALVAELERAAARASSVSQR